MNVAKLCGFICGAAASIALLGAPMGAIAQATSSGTTVTCNDGTTSKGGRGACSGHGGVNKSASSGSATPAAAPAAASAPAAAASSSSSSSSGTTVTCNDGTTSTGGRGAC